MVMKPELAPRGRPRDPQRREAILRAAIALVAEVGYDRMTVEALAARAGVSKPTIYRRWPGGKQEIVADAIRAKRPASLANTGSLRGDLLAMLGAVIEHVEEDVHLAGGLISQLRSSPELAALMHDEIAHDRGRYHELLARAVERGELAADARVTPLLADVAGSLIFTRAVVMLDEPLDRSFLEELVDHVLLPALNRKA